MVVSSAARTPLQNALQGSSLGRDRATPAATGDLYITRGARPAAVGLPSLAQLGAIALLWLSLPALLPPSCSCSWISPEPVCLSVHRLFLSMSSRPASLPVAEAPSAKLPVSLVLAVLAALSRLCRCLSHSACRAPPRRSAKSNSSSVEPVRRTPPAGILPPSLFLRRDARQHTTVAKAPSPASPHTHAKRVTSHSGTVTPSGPSPAIFAPVLQDLLTVWMLHRRPFQHAAHAHRYLSGLAGSRLQLPYRPHGDGEQGSRLGSDIFSIAATSRGWREWVRRARPTCAQPVLRSDHDDGPWGSLRRRSGTARRPRTQQAPRSA